MNIHSSFFYVYQCEKVVEWGRVRLCGGEVYS